MTQKRRNSISELAELIAENNLLDGIVSLEKIANEYGITHSYGDYGESFLGLLEYNSGKFHIFINTNQNYNKDHPRNRFTFAHELGHFFIDEHKSCLERGVSLTYIRDNNFQTSNIIEQEANVFASNLLLPKKIVLRKINNKKFGFDSILMLSDAFKTSLTCCCINYVNLDLFPSVIFKWDQSFSTNWNYVSKSFMNLVSYSKQTAFSLNLNNFVNFLKFEEIPAFSQMSQIYEEQDILSNWIPSVKKSFLKEIPLKIEHITIGKYGGLTLMWVPTFSLS